MSIYKDLEMVISDYVGYKEDEEYDAETGQEYMSMDCADTVLYDNLVDECSKHIDGSMPYELLSTDAKYCIDEWTSMMQHIPSEVSREM